MHIACVDVVLLCKTTGGSKPPPYGKNGKQERYRAKQDV